MIKITKEQLINLLEANKNEIKEKRSKKERYNLFNLKEVLEKQGYDSDLSDLDLSNMTLSCINLKGTSLKGANLTGTNLKLTSMI